METRLIPVIDASGLRNYREVPGGTFFEAARFVNGLLNNGERLDIESLDLTLREIDVLEKQAECNLIRQKIGELSSKKCEAIAANRSPRLYLNQLNGLSVKLWRLEREIKRACP
ncbi:hypothetical protein [Paenibacillus polymyxa]|uniref:hypothetical protein n=1 Tax=Paenibacillus polymyxa TaxID=1406 RepID=UPI0003D38F4A|nr:hypothetical protein [Paenibacillus polymyxa]AIW41812.1 hypothetical protein X809_38735 [Paenibacillus polymyxa CR1]